MESPSYEKDLHIALLAVQRAAILTKRVSSTLDKGVLSKADLSTVTIGDFAAQALLISALSAAFPNDVFVGEESAAALRENPALLERVWELVRTTHLENAESEALLKTPQSCDDMLALIDRGGAGTGGRTGRTWVLDPIDGTATFERGEQYAINLALLVDGVETLAVLGCPNLALGSDTISETSVDTTESGCLLSAIRGQGAYVRPLTTGAIAEGARIPRHADNVDAKDLRLAECMTTSSMRLDLHEIVAERLGAVWPATDLWSSLMKYAAIVVGGCNANIRITKKRSYKSCIWDHAGGSLLYREIGGKITDLEGKELDFGVGRRLSDNWGFVCAPSNLHEMVLKAVSEVILDANIDE